MRENKFWNCDIGIRTWSGSGSAVVYIDCAIDS